MQKPGWSAGRLAKPHDAFPGKLAAATAGAVELSTAARALEQAVEIASIRH